MSENSSTPARDYSQAAADRGAPVMKQRPLAVLYARYSPRPEPKENGRPLTKRQLMLKETAVRDREQNSCDKQIEYGREYCERMGYELSDDRIFRDDAMSGGSEKKRSGLKAAKAACKRGMIFIARDIKRVSRSMLDTFTLVAEFHRRGVIFETIADGRYDSSDVNKVMVFGIKAVIAHCERLSIGQDTSAKMRRHQTNLRRMSNIPPFGFAVDPEDESRLLPFDDEQPTIERMKQLRSEGNSLRAIGSILEGEGLLCRGRPWQHKSIKRILERTLQTGHV